MPSCRAIGESRGPNSTMAGTPPSTDPGTTKAGIETARNIDAPPGIVLEVLGIVEEGDDSARALRDAGRFVAVEARFILLPESCQGAGEPQYWLRVRGVLR